MKTSWQDLLDEFMHAQTATYRDEDERNDYMNETITDTIQAILEKLRDKDQAETTRIMPKSGPGNFVPGSAERGDQ